MMDTALGRALLLTKVCLHTATLRGLRSGSMPSSLQQRSKMPRHRTDWRSWRKPTARECCNIQHSHLLPALQQRTAIERDSYDATDACVSSCVMAFVTHMLVPNPTAVQQNPALQPMPRRVLRPGAHRKAWQTDVAIHHEACGCWQAVPHLASLLHNPHPLLLHNPHCCCMTPTLALIALAAACYCTYTLNMLARPQDMLA